MLNKKIGFLLTIILALIISCDSDVEISLGNIGIEQPESIFSVDFDGETWLADTATATILNGVTEVTAFKNENQEKVVVTIFADHIGSYTISPDQLVGGVVYQDINDVNGSFASDPTQLSGRMDIDSIVVDKSTLNGKFFFTGTRSIPQLDDLGNPVLDDEDNPIYITDSKDFTNGIFNNIVYITDIIIPPNPTENNEFFAEFNDVEYIDESITATMTEGVITITAFRDGTTEAITLSMPADINNNNYLLVGETTNPTEDTVATYRNNATSQFYGAGAGVDLPPTGSDVSIPLLSISNHDTTDNKITGSFKFTAFEVGGTGKVQIKEGSFSVTYIEQ